MHCTLRLCQKRRELGGYSSHLPKSGQWLTRLVESSSLTTIICLNAAPAIRALPQDLPGVPY